MTRVREGPGAPPKPPASLAMPNASQTPRLGNNAPWILAFGLWLVAFGCWLLAFGCWRLASGVRLLAFGFWLLRYAAIRCYMLLYAALRCFSLLYAALRCYTLLYTPIRSYTILMHCVYCTVREMYQPIRLLSGWSRFVVRMNMLKHLASLVHVKLVLHLHRHMRCRRLSVY